MRSVIFLMVLTNVLLLSACSAVGPRHPLSLAQRPSDCPELEGYPDCQDGRHVDFRPSQSVAAD